jgi:membrane-associated HD superfamily phosphohydrolase
MTADFGLKKVKKLLKRVSWGSTGLRRLPLVLFILSIILAILTIDFLPDKLTGIQEGKPSPKTVNATRDIEFIDFDKTEALREEAASHVQKIYNEDWTIESQVTDSVHKFFGQLRQVRSNS